MPIRHANNNIYADKVWNSDAYGDFPACKRQKQK